MLVLPAVMQSRLEKETVVPWIIIEFAYPEGSRYYTSAPCEVTMTTRGGSVVNTLPGLVLYSPPQVVSDFDRRQFTVEIADPAILPLLKAHQTGVKVTTTLFLLDPEAVDFDVSVNEVDGLGVYGGVTDGYVETSETNVHTIRVVATAKLQQSRVRSTTDRSQRLVDPSDTGFAYVDTPPESLILTWGR